MIVDRPADRTLVRRTPTLVMVVGASGPNADRVTLVLDHAKIQTLRLGSIAVATERVTTAMPHVVVIVSPFDPDETALFVDCVTAVGAAVIVVDPAVRGTAFEQLVQEILATAVQRRLARDQSTPALPRDASEPDASETSLTAKTQSEPPFASIDVDLTWE